jgi:hypothetical protein
MLKQISIIFSILLVIAASDSIIDTRYLSKAQTNSSVISQNPADNSTSSSSSTASQHPEKVFISLENLVIGKTSQGLVDISASVRNNQTFDVHDIRIQGEFFDKDGGSLGKIDDFVTQPSFILKPGASHNYAGLEIISHYKVDSSNFTATGEPLS